MAALLTWVAVFVAALAVLLKASDTFTTQAAKIGLSYGIPGFIVGVTIVAIGTSMPELASSLFAVWEGTSEIVVGNVVGSNIANIFLILGFAGVLGKGISVDRDMMRVDLPLLVGSAGFLAIAVWNSPFTVIEGVLFLGALAVYIHFTVSEKPAEDPELVADVKKDIRREPVGTRTYLVLAAALAVVFVSAYALVEAVIGIAAGLGIGTGLVAVTAVAIGTSLPELAVSVVAARNGTPEIAVGNILGSNIFNTFAVMGIPSLLGPVVVPDSIRLFALPVMLIATLLYFFITQDREITEWEAGTLLLLYALFLVNLAGLV